MAHFLKSTKGGCKGLTEHFERKLGADGQHRKYNNQDIDLDRVHLNYNLAPERVGGQLNFIRERTTPQAGGEERVSGVIGAKCLNRDDVKVMCSWLITAPRDVKTKELTLAENELKFFFEEAYKFLNDRYAGGSDKNVISAYVHMDETTPHMHYAFVPVVIDKKKGHEKVSAFEAVTRRDLQSFHKDLERHMEKVFGREIGILNGATKNGNKSIEELKRGTAQRELEVLQSNITQARQLAVEENQQISSLKEDRTKLESEIQQLNKERQRLDKEIEPIRELRKLRTTTEEIKIPEKTLLSGNTVKLPREQAEILKQQADTYIANREEIANIRNRQRAVKNREDTIIEWEGGVAARELSVAEKERKLEEKVKEVEKRLNDRENTLLGLEEKTEGLYQRQLNINEVLELTEEALEHYKLEYQDYKSQTSVLTSTNKILSSKISEAYEIIASFAQAIGMLKYHKEYTIANMTTKQSCLIDAIGNLGEQLVRKMGYEDLANDISKTVRISSSIQAHIDMILPPPQRSRGRDGPSL